MAESQLTLDKVVSLCKRRGFVFSSSEIYGGLASAWDYGPLGTELKNRIRDTWWREMTQLNDNIVGLNSAILMHPRVWEASGHVENFTDPLVDCKNCRERFKSDQIDWQSGICPNCNEKQLTEPRQFNLLFKTHVGPVTEEASVVYLRPETAQGSYVNFKNILQSSRLKIPFGIAQEGKAFRNEITTRNFIFRTREFEQMEMQYFVHPSEDVRWLDHWKARRFEFLVEELGIRREKLRMLQHEAGELAHYARDAFDIQYEYPFGWQELEGIHNRADYDLKQHMSSSGKDLSYLDDISRERFVPFIIETAIGLTRAVLAVLCDAYEEDEVEGETRTVLRFHPRLAPYTVAVFPLVKKDGLVELAREIEAELRQDYSTYYDQGGAIGRRYRRQDEIGTPFCVTVDYETKEDGTATVRLRDTMRQMRVPVSKLSDRIREEIRRYSRHSPALE